jgi:hypothetical protein
LTEITLDCANMLVACSSLPLVPVSGGVVDSTIVHEQLWQRFHFFIDRCGGLIKSIHSSGFREKKRERENGSGRGRDSILSRLNESSE